MRENARLVLYRVEALRAPPGAAGREQVDKNEWQRSSYVRTAVAYDALSGAGTQRGGSQGWRTTCRFSCVPSEGRWAVSLRRVCVCDDVTSVTVS